MYKDKIEKYTKLQKDFYNKSYDFDGINIEIETGGHSGGNCWDDSDPLPYSRDYTDNVAESFVEPMLAEILDDDTNYIKFIKIKKAVLNVLDRQEESRYEYYGNSTNYIVYKATYQAISNAIHKAIHA